MDNKEFMCQVDLITVDKANHLGIIACPELNYPDMGKTINFFSKFDPDVNEIKVFEAGEHDLSYVKDKDSGTWFAHKIATD